ncbi:MAG: M56 family metallopeptidase, partial [Phycisphaerae bacterium]|nr:M56 family metallopeptidase [Phycisphaerae bacterium]
MQIFIETINHFGAWLVENLRQLSIELLILAGIVLAVLFLLRVRSPRVRHAFWLLVLAKPVATLLIASPISLYWFLQPAAPAPSPPPRIVAVSPAPAQMPTPQRDYVPGHFPRRTGAISAPVEVQTPSAWSFVDVYGVAAVVWVVVASALGLRLLVGFIYVSFLRKTAEVQGRDTPLGEAMIEAARRLHMHPRARVALSGVSHAPVLAGIVRPMILLPRALPKQLPAEQVRLVIAHELTHVRRWDNLVLLLQRIAEMLLFFHPVVWLCGWVMRREAENACDDAVLRAYGLSAEYAESLTRVAETHHNLARRLLVNTFAAAESNLARRVRRILTGRGGRRTLILSIFAVVALILLGCLGLPTTAERKADSQEQPSSPAKEKQPVNINYSKLELKGNHETQDAFSLVVQAAARLYGRDVDYETLYALSTNAFAPDIRLDEPTKCHWQVQGRGRCLDLVARRIGLNVHMLPQPDRGKTPPAPDDPAQREAWLRTYYRLPFVEPVRQALAAGEVIITDRVWDYRDAFWCDWGIILEARDNGTLIGATTNGKKDNRMSHIGPSVPVLSNGESTISAHDADVEMLRLAFYRIHGSERFAPGPESGKGVVFGLAAMDAWIHQMNSVPYDTEQWEGNDRSADQAKKTALPTYEGAKVAAAYLRKRADTFAEGARPHLEAAAKHYDRIVKLLSPAITGKGGENYDRFMGNPAKQKAHIEHVLKPVKAELAAAADEMEQALAAEGVKVERTSNPGQPITVAASETETPAGEITQKRIDMPAPSDASGNTYARGMSAVLSHLGTNISYDRIMGLTGVAFILQLDTGGPFIDGELDSGWWPNDAWGFDLGLPVLSRATGWELRKIRCGEAYKTDPAAEYRRALAPTIETSLAAGKPVLAEYDHCFIVTAADNEEPPLLGYGTRGKSTQFKDVLRIADYPCGLIVFGEKTTPLNSKETDLLSLQHIVALFNEQAQGAGAPKTRFSGRGAWKEWLALMRKGVGCDNNMLIHLRYNRGSAVAYLREMAGHHTGKTKEHINAAADLYQQALDELNKQGLPYNRVQNGESEQVVLAEYTAMVERVFKLETQAVNKLEQALMAEGVKVSKSPSNSSVSSNGAETMSNPANTTSNEPLAKNVRREGGKVWIEGVQGFHPGEYANSVAGSGTRILQMLGESLSYDDLICYSAFAFRVEFHDKN